MWSEDKAVIGRLLVQRTPGDRSGPTATRLRIGRLLSSANARPPGLPPSAVLIVRRMADPLPGRLASGRYALLADISWERAVQDGLMQYFRSAATPVNGVVPANATAVRFADESELLACLARDISLGLAGQHWWWRVLLRSAWGGSVTATNGGHVGALVQQLTRQAHLVPAVLARLQEWGEAGAVLRILMPAQAQALLAAMLEARGLPSLPRDNRLPCAPRLRLGLPAGKSRQSAPPAWGASGTPSWAWRWTWPPTPKL